MGYDMLREVRNRNSKIYTCKDDIDIDMYIDIVVDVNVDNPKLKQMHALL